EISLITFPQSKNPQAMNESRSVRKLLGLSSSAERFKVYYGGYSGKNDEIAMMTRSMLQVMLELSADVRVPHADVALGKAAPGQVEMQASVPRATPSVNILSGNEAPPNTSIAVQYDRQWFWIADTDFHSKAVFAAVMMLFSIADVGLKGGGPIVTIPANG